MKTYLRVWNAALLLAYAGCWVSSAHAGSITILSDNFSDAMLGESTTSVDSNFYVPTGDGNVDVIGSIVNPPLTGVPSNIVPFESMCAPSGQHANCLDLNGTSTSLNGGPQATLESDALNLTAGTYLFSYDLMGASGFDTNDGPSGTDRNITTTTTILFGNSTCIISHTGCIYDSTISLGPTDTTSGDKSNISLTVGSGTDYIAFISDQSGLIGSVLGDVSLTEHTPTPEPSSFLLLGSVLLGLGGLGRRRFLRPASGRLKTSKSNSVR